MISSKIPVAPDNKEAGQKVGDAKGTITSRQFNHKNSGG